MPSTPANPKSTKPKSGASKRNAEETSEGAKVKGGHEESDLQKTIQMTVTNIVRSKEAIETLTSSLIESVTKAVLTEIQKNINFNTEQAHEVEKKITHLEEQIRHSKAELDAKTDELEQYTRQNNLRMFGVPEGTGREDTLATTLSLLKGRLGLEIKADEIEACHRLGVQSNSHLPRPIIVRFVSRQKRDVVLQNRRKLKGSRISIQEDLTAKRVAIFKEAQVIFGRNCAWTVNGQIKVKKDDKVIQIRSLEELKRQK